MEISITLAMKFWQWSILIALIIIGFIINLFDNTDEETLKYANDYFKIPSLCNYLPVIVGV